MPTRERRARTLGVPVDQLPDGRGKNPKPKGPKHYRWNTSRIVSTHGYVKVRVGVEHPLADPRAVRKADRCAVRALAAGHG